jgi:hypothetical protein
VLEAQFRARSPARSPARSDGETEAQSRRHHSAFKAASRPFCGKFVNYKRLSDVIGFSESAMRVAANFKGSITVCI